MSGRFINYVAGSKRRQRLAAPVLRAVGAAVPRVKPPREPVFVLGTPRSGTTVLFQLLGCSSRLGSLDGEAHLLWELFHPSSATSASSHETGPADITERERRTLYWLFSRVAGPRRYLDKTPSNSLRVPYLNALCPDARFVFLKRDARAVVSSLMTAWRSEAGTFTGKPVPGGLDIQGYEGANWKFLRPPDWRRYSHGRTLAEVCAYQWVASNEAILAGRRDIGQDRWVEVRYEDLVERPEEEAARLLTALDLPVERSVLERARILDRHVTRVTGSGPSCGEMAAGERPRGRFRARGTGTDDGTAGVSNGRLNARGAQAYAPAACSALARSSTR